MSSSTDKLERYLMEPVLHDESIDILTWWRNQRSRFPLLTKWAFDTFSIPAMSSEPERVFSSTKHIISSERSALKPKTIKTLECTKQWMKAGIYTKAELNAIAAMEVDELNPDNALN